MSAPPGLACAACGLSLPRSSFSGMQQKKTAETRRCMDCTNNGIPIDEKKSSAIRAAAAASSHSSSLSTRSSAPHTHAHSSSHAGDDDDVDFEFLVRQGHIDAARMLSEPGDRVTRAEIKVGGHTKRMEIHSSENPEPNMMAWGDPMISINMITNISNRRDGFGPNAPPMSLDLHRSIQPPSRTVAQLRQAAAPAVDRDNLPEDPAVLKAVGQACLELGDVLMGGYRTDRKPNEACDWYWRSADCGNPEGITQCAQICLKKLEADNVLISSKPGYVAPVGSKLLQRHGMFNQLVYLIAMAYDLGEGYISPLAFTTLRELKQRGIVDMPALARANLRGAAECVEILKAATAQAEQNVRDSNAKEKAVASGGWVTRNSTHGSDSGSSSSSSSSAAVSSGVLGCSGCGRSPLSRSEFSSAQLKKLSSVRRCKQCVAGGSGDPGAQEPGADDGPGHQADAAEPGGASQAAASSSSSSSSSSSEVCNPLASAAPAECPILLANPNLESDAVCGHRHNATDLESLLLADHHWRRAFPVNVSEEGRDATFSKSYANELECAVCRTHVPRQAFCKCQAVAYCSPQHRQQDAAQHEPLCALMCEEVAPAPEGASAEELKKQQLQQQHKALKKLRLKCFIGPSDSTACYHVVFFFSLPEPANQTCMYFMDALVRHGQGLRTTTLLRAPPAGPRLDPLSEANISPFLEVLNPERSQIPSWKDLMVAVSPDVATLFLLKGLRDQEEGSQPPEECTAAVSFCRMLLKQRIVSASSVLHSIDSYKGFVSSSSTALYTRILQAGEPDEMLRELKKIPRNSAKSVGDQLPISTNNYPRDLNNIPLELITWNLWSTLNMRAEYRYEASLVTEIYSTLSSAQQRGGSERDAVNRAIKTGRLNFAGILSKFDEPAMRLPLHRRLTWYAFHQALWHAWRKEPGLSALFQLQVDALEAPGEPVGKVPLARALVFRSCTLFDQNLEASLPSALVTFRK